MILYHKRPGPKNLIGLLPLLALQLCTTCVLLADSVVVVNEIMYHPRNGEPEWIELYNQMGTHVDMSGWSLTGAVEYTFPEGTILRGGALGPFRLGAFLTAAELQCPVVPISLEGTERVMPDDHRWRVYHHPIRVRIHAPIHPKGRNRPDLAWLRDQARMRIARSLEAEASPHHAESARRDRNTG